MNTYNHFIDGQYVEPVGKKWIDSIDPYLGKPWARIPQGCPKDVDLAVAAASRAMREGPWASMNATQRGKLMLRLADLVAQNAERLAELEVRDNGKLLAEMRGQLNYHPEWWRYYGGLADKIEGAHARLAQLYVPTGQVVRRSRIVSHANPTLDISEKHSLGLVLPERRTSGLHLRRLQRCRLERLYQLLNRAGSPCRITYNGITIR